MGLKSRVLATILLTAPSLIAGAQESLTAVFQSERSERAEEEWVTKTVDWRFERADAYVAVTDVAGKRSERWLKDDRNRVWYSRVFYTEKKVIDYQPADLSIGGVGFPWERISGVIDRTVLDHLTKSPETASVLGRAATVYRGTLDGIEMEVWWLPQEGIPALVSQRGKRQRSTLRLLSLDVGGAPNPQWQQGSLQIEGFESIDFSDLGDRHQDPFVESLMQHEGSWFGHGH